jgi:SPP1 family predicted phage head-tail adaptor
MDIGRLRERVTLQQATTTTDAQGGSATTWATLDTVWASIEPVSGREQIQAGAMGSQVGYRVGLRYRGDLSASHRLAWTPFWASTVKTLEITSVSPSPDHRSVELLCVEVA